MDISRSRFPLHLGGAAVVLAAAILVQKQSGPDGKSDLKPETPLSVRAVDPAETLPSKPLNEPPRSQGSPDNQDWIESRITELDQLAWLDDPGSLRKILTELRSSSPRIRAAALEATRTFASRDAVPYLEALSRDTRDPLEQKAIKDLIDHLNLPTLLEQSGVKGNE